MTDSSYVLLNSAQLRTENKTHFMKNLSSIAESNLVENNAQSSLTDIEVNALITSLHADHNVNLSPKVKNFSSHDDQQKILPNGLRNKMEQSFLNDFSTVRVFEGSKASSINALAYTQGENIFFAPGQYNPYSGPGQKLIGHELAHVVQRREGKVKPTSRLNGQLINTDAGLEQAADKASNIAVNGSEVNHFNNNDMTNQPINKIIMNSESLSIIQGKFILKTNEYNNLDELLDQLVGDENIEYFRKCLEDLGMNWDDVKNVLDGLSETNNIDIPEEAQNLYRFINFIVNLYLSVRKPSVDKLVHLMSSSMKYEEKRYYEINSKLSNINIFTLEEDIGEIANELNDSYLKRQLQAILDLQSTEYLTHYENLGREGKKIFIKKLQEELSEDFADTKEIDISDESEKYGIISKYFSLLNDFDNPNNNDSSTIKYYKNAAIKRILLPEGYKLMKKGVEKLEGRKLRIALHDKADIESSEEINPHFATIPYDSDKEIGGERYSGKYSYPKMEQQLDLEEVNNLYNKDPQDFIKTAMSKDPKGIYKVGTKNVNAVNDIKEILVIIDPYYLQIQIGEDKKGDLKFYLSPIHLAIHHEELHMARGMRGAGREGNTLPKPLQKIYHTLEEFLTISAGKSNERMLNKQMGLPLRVGHGGVTIGKDNPIDWRKQLFATHLAYAKNNFTQIDFNGWNLSNENLKNATLIGAYLERAILNDANLQDAKLQGSHLSLAIMKRAKLQFALLTDANLYRADLEEAQLQYSNMKGATLTKTDFTNANLSNADLEEADLSDVILTGTNLEGANMKNVKNLDKKNLNMVIGMPINVPED